MFVLFIFCFSSVQGTVLKAVLMSIVARSIRFASSGGFSPSYMCCVSVVISVVVECLAVKPCWVGKRDNIGGDLDEDQPLKDFETWSV